MMNHDNPNCTHCSGRTNGEFCCDKAELETLRGAFDQAITMLDSEMTAPLVIDDGGAVREVARQASEALKRARRVA